MNASGYVIELTRFQFPEGLDDTHANFRLPVPGVKTMLGETMSTLGRRMASGDDKVLFIGSTDLTSGRGTGSWKITGRHYELVFETRRMADAPNGGQ